jgi:hypothetical protein
MMWGGQDPCIHIIRLYESPEHAEGIEESHSPSMWRKIELSHLSSFQKEYGYKDKN